MYIMGGIAALSVVVLVIALAALARGGGGDGSSATILVPTPRPSGVAQSGHVFGSADAPVTITEYLDFQCPFCRRAATDVMPTIEQQFIATGKAKLEVHPITILGSESVQAAAAAECANDQGRFWGYHDMLYANQGAEQSGSFSQSRLKQFASLLNMDSNAFDSCLDSSKYVGQVQQNTTAARAAGVRSTPTFMVNGTAVSTTIDALSAAIGQAAGD
jgi:protein-disulfide isomerase